jgi:outer membrane protein assembly factor BamB
MGLGILLLGTLAVSRGAETPPGKKETTVAQWTHWRGPSGQGYSEDTQVPLTWSESQNLLWKTPLPGRGNSSPILHGERIFLTASSKDGYERYVLCVNRADGKLLWQRTASKGVPPGKTHNWNGYASASCTTDGERVYAFFGTPGLFCYDGEGNLVWKHSFGIFTSETGWGTAASPFLYEDLIIQNCDNDGPRALPAGAKPEDAAPMALVALDKVTGKVRWQTPRNQGRGFSTPRLLTGPGGRVELVLNGPNGVWSYEPRTGKEIWHCRRTNKKEQEKFGEPIPVSNGELLIAPSGRPGPCQAIRLGGSGDVTKTHLQWQIERKGRDVASQILWGDYLYAIDSRGVFLTCYEAASGKIKYHERIAHDAQALASPVAVRGKLLFVLDSGETVVVEPGPKLKIAARNVLGHGGSLDFAASPAIADGRLYLRSQSYLYCVGEKR